MTENPDVVIMCSGKGERISRLTAKYGCKSLIPIGGRPALEYILTAIRAVTDGKLFLCVDKSALIPRIEKMIEILEIHDTEIYIDKGMGTVHSLYELNDKIRTERTFILFAHHLIAIEHLRKMQSAAREGVVVSLYPTSSDNLRKITSIEKGLSKYFRLGDENAVLKRYEQYADAPYLVPKAYIEAQADAHVRSYEATKRWHESGGSVIGIKAGFPHEFHVTDDLQAVERFARKLKHRLSISPRIKKKAPTKRSLYVLILSGPAGSGKSTVADILRKVLPTEPAYISLDDLKHMIFVATSTDHYLDLAARNALPIMKNFLDAGHAVIIDKAFGKYAYVKPFINEARRRKVPVHYAKFTASLEELLRRNRTRQHYIPEWRVEEMHRFHKMHSHPLGIEIDTEKDSVNEIVRLLKNKIESKKQ